jgi:hypothetical protein
MTTSLGKTVLLAGVIVVGYVTGLASGAQAALRNP